MEGLVVYRYIFLGGYGPQVPDDVRNAYPVEVECLAAGQDGGQDLVLLRGREYENRVCRWFFQGLEEGVEGGSGEHMHLVYDVHAVLSDLRRDLHLVHQALYVVHSVVGCGVKLVDAVRAPFLEGDAGFALAARLHILRRVGAIDGLCEYPGSRGLAHSPRTAE